MTGLDKDTLTRLQKIHFQEQWSEAEKQRLVTRNPDSGRAKEKMQISLPVYYRLLIHLGCLLVACGEGILDRYEVNSESNANKCECLIS